MIVLDFIFGGLLRLPSDLTIIVLALLTGVILTFVRKWTTNQDRLGRAVADNKRLRALIKEALARDRLTKAQVAMVKFKQEGKPMLVSLLPIALLVTGAFARLEFLPPQPGETVTAIAHAPVAAAGDLVHLVPAEGVTALDGWMKQLTVTGPEASAVWQLQFARLSELTIRGRDAQLELKLRERRLFGIVPGWPTIGLPAWWVGYLLIVIPFVPLLKKVTRIH